VVVRAAPPRAKVEGLLEGTPVIGGCRESLVVIGNGMAGARVVEEILARAPDGFTIVMFGEEAHGAYSRIQLAAVLGGFQEAATIMLNPFEWYQRYHIRLHAGVRAERIDRSRRVVVGRPASRSGGPVMSRAFVLEEPYDKLILATGSRPFIPPIEGADKDGVFVFRTLEDCAVIAERARKSRTAAVIGGGLLGLEAARGLHSLGVEVAVIEAAPYLMMQQLDPAAGAVLRQQMERLGVRVFVGTETSRFLGHDAVEGLEFKDGSTLEADLVVLSCGIRPSAEVARESGLSVNRAVLVDDQLRTSDPDVFAVGECAEHRGQVYGLVDPLYEQARVLADVITGANPDARYPGSRPATTLKVMGVDLVSMGEVHGPAADAQVVVDSDPPRGLYRKLVVRAGQLAGAIVLGETGSVGTLMRLFKHNAPVPEQPLELLLARAGSAADGATPGPGVESRAEDVEICNCHRVPKGQIVQCIRSGCTSVKAIGQACKAGTGCGSCQTLLGQLLAAYAPDRAATTAGPAPKLNKIERMKQKKDGLDVLPDVLHHAGTGNWQELTEDDKQRFKWKGLFFRKQTPGHFMLRLRLTCGFTNARQFRVIADLSDQYGKGFCDLTTRQQIQMRWFTLAEVPAIWRQLEEVGLHSKQTGMDNIRGVCGCPVAGLTPHELFDASPVAREFTARFLDNPAYTNLPRKFNVTITGCLENCCHTATQDLALVPAYRELDGQQSNGFNVLVGGKQGSGGYTPAESLDVFVRPEEAARLCCEVVRLFRDHGSRETRTRARLAFLLQDRGVAWFRAELERAWGQPLHRAGPDLRKQHQVDHLGIHPQKSPPGYEGPPLHSVGLLVPVGRITTAQMRGVADLAERYGSGDLRLTVQQNLLIANVPENRLGALTEEPLLRELPFDPSPILRGLVSCTGMDYCHFALIETKDWAIQVAQELERRTQGRKLAPLTIHWSGCPAGCGMHQVATIGLQGCRARVNGQVVDAAHVYVDGKSGPKPQVAKDLLYDVPCAGLADALEPLVRHLPR
jgi:nitrite reductase (NADH) large subunit